MARNTNTALREQVIYSVYVRNHTPEGTFRTVIPDLDRIRALGTDIVWFMPIHPIGEKGKKGSLGCVPTRTAITARSIPSTARLTISRRSWTRSTRAA